MIRTKLFLASALMLVVAFAASPASAQQPTNQITYFTFSAPFELPGGKVLPAGKYVFKIVDSPSNRHVVQVMSEDQTTMHATLMAIPAQRQDPADEPEVRFMEAAADAAPAVRTWWYPGRTIGHEFIYPKDHARRLAAAQSGGVLTVAGDATGDDAMKSGDLARVGRDGQETALNAETTNERTAENAATPQTQPQSTTAQSATAAETTSPEPAASATGTQSAAAQETTPTPAPTPSAQQTAETQPRTATTTPAISAQTTAQTTPQTTPADDTTARTELPRTATALPFIALLGFGSLVGAGLLRLRR